jgi:mannitol-1-phosphate 5-dehydrogenase
MKTLVHFGAGNIGRSLIGYLFSQMGYRIVFVEKNLNLVNALNTRKQYAIEIREQPIERYRVENIEGISIDDHQRVVQQIVQADMLSTAVGAQYLSDLFPVMKDGLERRKDPVNILICENVKNAAKLFEDGFQRLGFRDVDNVGFVESSIEKIVPNVPEEMKKDDILLTWTERYSTIHVNRERIRGQLPDSPFIIPVSDFEAYYERKIFVANLSHTLTSVIGFLNGFRYLAEALHVEPIRAFVEAAADEACQAVEKKYPLLFEKQDRAAYCKQFLTRLANPLLKDSVYRGGRHIERKLHRGERFLGPALLFVEYFHTVPKYLAKGIAGAFYFQAPDEHGIVYQQDREFQERLHAEGIEKVLQSVCEISPEEDMSKAILDEFNKGTTNFLAENLK